MCLLTFSLPGEGFPMRILSFHFSFFESPLGSARARFCVPLRLSGATRGPLVLVSSSLGSYFGCPGAPKLSQSRILDPGSWIQDPGSRILDPGSVIETALGHPGTQNRIQESLRQAREGPELHRRASMERKIVPERSPKDSQKTRNENSIFS